MFEDKQNQNDDFDQDLLAEIKKQKIKPRSRWCFVAKNYLIWALGVLAMVLGAVAVSLMIFLGRATEARVYFSLNNFGEALVLLVPIFWICSLALFIILFYFNIKHTKKGYRYNVWLVLGVALAGSVILGIVGQAAGLGQEMDDLLGRRAPFYDRVMNPQVRFWNEPEEGRLSGIVIAIEEEGDLILMAQDEIEWQVLVSGSRRAPGLEIVVGRPIRCLGTKLDASHFQAEEILPMRAGRKFFERLGPPPSQRPRPVDDVQINSPQIEIILPL